MPVAKFPCPVCQKNFVSEEKLQRHTVKHTENRPYTCHICPGAYHSKANLKRHINEVHAEKNVACPLCDRKFQCLDYINKHMKSHSRDEPVKSIHRKKFSSKGKENQNLPKREKSCDNGRSSSIVGEKKLKQNVKTKLIQRNGSAKFLVNGTKSKVALYKKSRECDESESSSGSSDTAENGCRKAIAGTTNSSYDGLKRHVCHICNKRFSVNSSLNRHVREIHENNTKFSYPLCDKKSQAQNDVQLHVKSQRVNDQQRAQESTDKADNASSESKSKGRKTVAEKFVCSKCDKTFNKADSLEKHSKSHVPPEVFTCNQCKESFVSKTRLAAHIAAHVEEEESPERCNRNGVSAMKYQALEKFLCTLCEPVKTFQKEYNFQAHFESVHEIGEGNGYTCVHCSDSFSFKVNLQFHIEHRHVDIGA